MPSTSIRPTVECIIRQDLGAHTEFSVDALNSGEVAQLEECWDICWYYHRIGRGDDFCLQVCGARALPFILPSPIHLPSLLANGREISASVRPAKTFNTSHSR